MAFCDPALSQAVERLASSQDPYLRYCAIDHLGGPDLCTVEVLKALVSALADDGYWETSNPDGPSQIYAVADRALEALQEKMPEAYPVFEEAAARNSAIASAGAALYRAAGERGQEVLREHARRDDPVLSRSALNQLIQTVRDSKGRPPRRSLCAILHALAHGDGGVRFDAMSYLPYYFKEFPEQGPLDFVEDEFVDALAAAIANGRAQMETGLVFADDPRILQAWVDVVAQGHDQPSSYGCLTPHLSRLDDGQVRQLVDAPLHPTTIGLLGDLKERTVEAIPRLVQALDDSEKINLVAVALAKIPGGLPHIADRLADQFINDEASRRAIVANHSDLKVLAQDVIPRLKERWNSTKDLGWLRGMEALGPLMVVELDWLATHLKKYGVDSHARMYAMSIVGTFGPEAAPIFPQLRELLDYTDTRGIVLKTLAKLGPDAVEFLPRLREMRTESERWLVWQRNWWTNPLNDALTAIAKNEGSE